MANDTPRLAIPSWLNNLTRYRSLLVPVAFISLLAVIVVPMSPMIMDLLITLNLALGVHCFAHDGLC